MSLKERYLQMLEKAKEEVTFCEEMLQLLGKMEESPPQPIDHTQVIGNLIDPEGRTKIIWKLYDLENKRSGNFQSQTKG